MFSNKIISLVGATVMGACFAFGWTPCVGPILAGILAYAGTLENVNQGILLLLFYSMGLGIPFILTAFGVDRFLKIFSRLKRYLGIFDKAAGIAMIGFGLMIYSNSLIRIPAYLPFLNRFGL